MKVLSHICNGIFITLLIGVLAIFVAPMLPLHRAVEIKIVESGSMEPHIQTGALVFIAPARTYQQSDVITFSSRYGDVPTTHRIANIEQIDGQTYFTTKGDANEEVDQEKIKAGDIIGKVYLDVPYAGFILDFARQPVGFSLLIVLPALLIILGEVSKIWAEMKRLRTPDAVQHGAAPHPAPLPVPAVAHAPIPLLMLDIATPVRFTHAQPQYANTKPRADARRARNRRGTLLAALLLVAFGIGSNSALSPLSTVSYARDEEMSTPNILAARALDFSVTGGGQYVFDGDVVIMTVVAPSAESGLLRYDVRAVEVGGPTALCADIEAHIDAPVNYHGALLSLSQDDVDLSLPWTFPVTLGGGPGAHEGETCTIELVFDARHADANTGAGYTDEERVTLGFSVPASSPAPTPFAPLLLSDPFAAMSALEGPPADPGESPEANTEHVSEDVPATPDVDTTEPPAQDAPDTPPADTENIPAPDAPPADTPEPPTQSDDAPEV